MEVVPRSHKNCTEEILAIHNRTEVFVDSINAIIKSAGSPVHCNGVAPPLYKLGGNFNCSYPKL
jgi:hypothetical protein